MIIEKEKIDITFVSETWLPEGTFPKSKKIIKFSNSEKPAKSHAPYGVAVIVGPGFDEKKIKIIQEKKGFGLTLEVDGGLYIAGLYIPPKSTSSVDKDKEFVKRFLSSLPEQLFHASTPRILLGDLNMRLGTRTGDHGQLCRAYLHSFLNDMGLLMANHQGLEPTFCRNLGGKTSTPDYIFACERVRVRDIAVLADWDTDSDHRLLVADISVSAYTNAPAPTATAPSQREPRSFNLRRTRDPIRQEKFQGLLAGPLMAISDECAGLASATQAEVDQIYSGFQDHMLAASLKVFGKNPRKDRPRRVAIEDPRYIAAKQQRNQTFRRLRMLHGQRLASDPPTAEEIRLLSRYKALVAEQKRVAKACKLEAWDKFCRCLDEMSPQEQMKLIRSFKTGSARVSSPLKATSDDLHVYAAFFAEQFS